MFGEDSSKHILAKSPRRECCNQNIGVEDNPHEMSRNISSSVSQPRASAKGATDFLSSSNLEIAICLRRASRISSLFGRPLCLASFRRSESSFLSRRTVIVLMYYVEIRIPCSGNRGFRQFRVEIVCGTLAGDGYECLLRPTGRHDSGHARNGRN